MLRAVRGVRKQTSKENKLYHNPISYYYVVVLLLFGSCLVVIWGGGGGGELKLIWDNLIYLAIFLKNL